MGATKIEYTGVPLLRVVLGSYILSRQGSSACVAVLVVLGSVCRLGNLPVFWLV